MTHHSVTLPPPPPPADDKAATAEDNRAEEDLAEGAGECHLPTQQVPKGSQAQPDTPPYSTGSSLPALRIQGSCRERARSCCGRQIPESASVSKGASF